MNTPASRRALEISDLTVRFGGHEAVSHVDLVAPQGAITGLIGPNGAGKTTFFNACNGLQRLSSGRVGLYGRDVTRASPSRRAQLGLGRTFQRFEVCEVMTVRRNVALGSEARAAGSQPLKHVFAGRAQRASIQAATAEAIERCGLSDVADEPMASMSTGRRRLVELARVMAAGFSFLLLDEPSSGLDEDETVQFGEVLRQFVSDRGVGLLLVEHDMSLVMSLCDRLYVLEHGRLIFEGSTHEARNSAVVRSAYLGDDAEAVVV
jgi:ABC-type branched-subunit amino acid transport system ATPase component